MPEKIFYPDENQIAEHIFQPIGREPHAQGNYQAIHVGDLDFVDPPPRADYVAPRIIVPASPLSPQ
jgi:hypothetical protein